MRFTRFIWDILQKYEIEECKCKTSQKKDHINQQVEQFNLPCAVAVTCPLPHPWEYLSFLCIFPTKLCCPVDITVKGSRSPLIWPVRIEGDKVPYIPPLNKISFMFFHSWIICSSIHCIFTMQERDLIVGEVRQ